MIAYLLEIPYLKYLFFLSLTKFQKCVFKRIHWILTSSNGQTRFLWNRSLYVEVFYTVITYENGKFKRAHYLVQLIDLEVLDDQQYELFPEWQEVVSDPALARAIGFYNIYGHWLNKVNANALWEHHFCLS